MKILSNDFKGLYAKGTPDECPKDYAITCKNLMTANNGGIVVRPGFPSLAPLYTKPNITHISIYQPSPVLGVVSPKTIVHQSSGSKSIFNNTDLPGAAIYISSSDYHSWANFFGRGYFTLHNTITGNLTEKVQVYEGGASSRNAMGLKPVSVMAGVAAAGGVLAVGNYLLDVAYVTSSGFITRPSGSVLNMVSNGSYKVDLTAIPIGPAGTVARRIIMTKSIPLGTYTGNPNDYEFFFLPTGLINDNVTTIYTASEYDGNLISSSNYLLNNLESIPSGVGIGDYNGRMLVWGENANPSMVRISSPADPESMSSTSGYLIIDPTETGGVTNCIALRNNLYIFKGNRIFITQDNGGNPSTWPVSLYDSGIGTETYGTSKIFDSKGVHLNQFLIAARSGLVVFDGLIQYPELTYNVSDIWDDIDPTKFGLVRVAIDPIYKNIYILIPRNNGTKQILYADYSFGMTKEDIRWYLWDITNSPDGSINAIAIGIDNTNKKVLVTLGLIGILASFNPANPVGLDDSGASSNNTFTAVLQSGVIATDPSVDIQQISLVKMRQKGGSVGDITVQGISGSDSTIVSPIYTIPFKNKPTKIQDEWVYLPFVDNQPTIKFNILGTNKPNISHVIVDSDVYGESGPR